MNSRIFITLILASFAFFTACSQHDQTLELNNGEKWEVTENMMVIIQTMDKHVATYKGESLQQHQNLAESLTTNIDALTSNCTMTGPAHDALHVWLVPYIDIVDEYSNAKTIEEGNKYYQETKESFKIFNKYFK